MPSLFDPLTIKSVPFRNRVGVSPMCEYSSDDGFASDWHLVHLGSRAVGGAGLVMTEAAAVEARGRISPQDLGIWKDEHIEPLSRVTRFIASQGAVPAIQLAHAGRKASTAQPWKGGKAVQPGEGGWTPVGPTAEAFDDGYPVPEQLTSSQIREIRDAYAAAARRSDAAGFAVAELHFAHGYLVHSFLSPISNRRTDEYGGSFDNRVRIAIEVTRAVRGAWPDNRPLFARLSCVDWVPHGWDIEQSIELSRRLKAEGVDLIDCSSGGIAPRVQIDAKPNYQVPFADAVRRQAGIATAAVGMITEPRQADEIVRNEQADIVLLAREFLRDAYWPLRAAVALDQKPRLRVPEQYLRSW